ncbi:putative secreted protein [Streptomyces davaonensis JCM 4913]|uniref:Putative secreted protein n=2 Tax=Streptomyces davaonensis TaxID=348043 RepID=K4R4S5_STRDJ|nr:putative secreted protein [Streptomyces davaonensis JCM 4913]
MPNPRLTGLGVGLFCLVLMLALGSLVSLLFGSSLTVYGVLFLPVCVLTAAWVRRADLVTAVIIVPIAFALGLLPVADGGGGGTGDRLMGLFTALATEAGWLYGGTLITGVIVTVRKVRQMRRRVARNRIAG